MKYVIYLDYMTGANPNGYKVEYIKTAAKDVMEAIELADATWRMHDDLYLIRVMEKDGNNYKVDGLTATNYKAVMCKRSDRGGWHRNTKENCESEHIAAWYRTKHDTEWIGAI